MAESRRVTSNQSGIHEQLTACVEKHHRTAYRKPLAAFNQDAFARANAFFEASDQPLILDSCCGVGESTRQLAKAFPGHCVIGVDRSENRLQRQIGPLPDNAFLVRADLADFWRLAVEASWQPAYHFLLYPNPYPKKKDIKLRWHGHPVFPWLVQLGGHLESRSNWRLYLEEMQAALAFYGHQAVIKALQVSHPLTPFERKYQRSNQPLWQLTATLNPTPELNRTPQ